MTTRRVLLRIDFFNPSNFQGVQALAGPALRAARNTSRLKDRLRRFGIPAIYANDNFGQWDAEFSALVSRCAALRGASGEIARLLSPQPGDRALLKPRHSAFYGTALEFLLDELQTELLILTGTSTFVHLHYCPRCSHAQIQAVDTVRLRGFGEVTVFAR